MNPKRSCQELSCPAVQDAKSQERWLVESAFCCDCEGWRWRWRWRRVVLLRNKDRSEAAMGAWRGSRRSIYTRKREPYDAHRTVYMAIYRIILSPTRIRRAENTVRPKLVGTSTWSHLQPLNGQEVQPFFRRLRSIFKNWSNLLFKTTLWVLSSGVATPFMVLKITYYI
jgi:hypothetical protein